MPVPTVITDLSTTAASNSPAGSDSIGNPGTIDDYFRGYGAVQRAESLNKSWERWNHTPTYISATQFSVATDLTAVYTVNRRIKATVTAGTVYGRITASAYTTVTTVTVSLDSGNLDSGLSEVMLGPENNAALVGGAKVASGKMFNVSNTITLAGTDNKTYTFPTTDATIARTDAAQTFTDTQSFNGSVAVMKAATAGDVTTARQLRIGVDTAGPYSVYAGYYNTGTVGFAGVLQALDNDIGALLRLNPSGGDVGIGSGRLYGTALHNNAGAVTGTTNQYIASGTYTPTVTNGANVTSSSAGVFQWIRVGNVVSVSGRVAITATASATSTTFALSLPIASNFADVSNLAGVFHELTNALTTSGAVGADTTNDRATSTYSSGSASPLSDGLYVTFQYVIL